MGTMTFNLTGDTLDGITLVVIGDFVGRNGVLDLKSEIQGQKIQIEFTSVLMAFSASVRLILLEISVH